MTGSAHCPSLAQLAQLWVARSQIWPVAQFVVEWQFPGMQTLPTQMLPVGHSPSVPQGLQVRLLQTRPPVQSAVVRQLFATQVPLTHR